MLLIVKVTNSVFICKFTLDSHVGSFGGHGEELVHDDEFQFRIKAFLQLSFHFLSCFCFCRKLRGLSTYLQVVLNFAVNTECHLERHQLKRFEAGKNLNLKQDLL